MKKPKVTLDRVIFNPNRAMIFDVVTGSWQHDQRNGLYAHQCYDNNELLIDENDPEFSVCNCGKPNPKT